MRLPIATLLFVSLLSQLCCTQVDESNPDEQTNFGSETDGVEVDGQIRFRTPLSISQINDKFRGRGAGMRLLSEPIVMDDGSTYEFPESQLTESLEVLNEMNRVIAVRQGISPIEVDSPFFCGDIILTPEQARYVLYNIQHSFETSLGKKRRFKRKMVTDPTKHWSNKKFFYQIDQKARGSPNTMNAIGNATSFWRTHTCIDFEEAKGNGNYVLINKNGGCASMQGMIGGIQPLYLGDGCEMFGIAAHEMGHAMGFYHEQSRPDRDKYVHILFENIKAQDIYNFHKCTSPDQCRTNTVPFDYGSVMHYGSKAFSSNKEYTIVTKDVRYLGTLGSRRQGPTFYDVMQVNREYCSSVCKGQVSCKNGGYAHPRDCTKCLCPSGWIGRLCDELEVGKPSACGGKLKASQSWQSISSPNYPSPHPKNQQCTWYIEAPTDGKVIFEFEGPVFKFIGAEGPKCDWDYVELKIQKDQANTGPRFCLYDIPRGQYISETNKMLVLMRTTSTEAPMEGFKGRFKTDVRTPVSTTAKKECLVSAWSDWTPCSNQCGTGTKARIRHPTNLDPKKFYEGLMCPSLTEVENCEGTDCAAEQRVTMCQGANCGRKIVDKIGKPHVAIEQIECNCKLEMSASLNEVTKWRLTQQFKRLQQYNGACDSQNICKANICMRTVMQNIGGSSNVADMSVCTSAEPFHRLEDAFHGDDHVDVLYRKYHHADMIGRANSHAEFIAETIHTVQCRNKHRCTEDYNTLLAVDN